MWRRSKAFQIIIKLCHILSSLLRHINLKPNCIKKVPKPTGLLEWNSEVGCGVNARAFTRMCIHLSSFSFELDSSLFPQSFIIITVQLLDGFVSLSLYISVTVRNKKNNHRMHIECCLHAIHSSFTQTHTQTLCHNISVFLVSTMMIVKYIPVVKPHSKVRRISISVYGTVRPIDHDFILYLYTNADRRYACRASV